MQLTKFLVKMLWLQNQNKQCDLTEENKLFKIDNFLVKILWLICKIKTLQFDGKNHKSGFRKDI